MKEKDIKIFVFCFLMIAVSFLFWQHLSLLLESPTFLKLVLLAFFTFLFFCFLVVVMLLVKKRKFVYLTIALSSLLFFIFFKINSENFSFFIIGIVLFFALLIVGYEYIQHERKQRIKISYVRVWKRGLPFLIIAVSLIISLTYYFNPLLKIGQEEIKIPQGFFSTTIAPFKIITGQIIPFYQKGMTVDEMIAATQGQPDSKFNSNLSPQLINQIKEKIGNDKNLNNLSLEDIMQMPEVKSLINNRVNNFDKDLIKQKRKELEKSFNIKLKGSETIDELIGKIINNKLSDFIGPYSKEISIGIAIALFFVLEFIGKILSILVIMLSSILIKFLIKLNLINIEKKQVLQKTLKL